ncbi:hypothetical protein [Maritimibacter fusiformis]|jgi:hypothetical protein|uniref:Uncharacterized protein n=1 Tax=Maritimibacter fusiformis TaxID=2603819 RepID=A0A5D0RH03_9RHOB|nr:hypothetical protein [Maritimibacter fusiformis]TYB79998.1 hypothetical protein FVF75_14270 [Maritimibacter fusiformis]
MSPLLTGLIAGLAFGLVSVVTMLPMTFEDRPRALAASFASRFAIGFLIPNLSLGGPDWLVGAAVGLMISASDAIVTRAYAPILGMGALGGALIGWLA